VAEVDLGLDSRRGLEAYDGGQRPVAPKGTDEVLDEGAATAVAALPDLLEQPDGAQIILGEASAQIVGEWVDGAGPLGSRGASARRPLEEERLDGMPMDSHLAGDPADGQLLGGELSDERLLFDSKQRVPPPRPLLRSSDRTVHFPGAVSRQFCGATDTRAGWWMLTTDTELSGDAVIDLYQGLSVVEHAFRELKSPLKARPVYHWKEERVRAHLFLCVLSYWLTRWIELEGRSKGWKGVTAEEALDHLRQVHLDELGIPGLSARWWAVKELVGAERSIVESLGIAREVSELPRTLT
jgi:hypothetical protein